jgi:hypothetical protein
LVYVELFLFLFLFGDALDTSYERLDDVWEESFYGFWGVSVVGFEERVLGWVDVFEGLEEF